MQVILWKLEEAEGEGGWEATFWLAMMGIEALDKRLKEARGMEPNQYALQ